MIQFKHVMKQYQHDHPVVSDINLDIPTGVFGLLGPNGAGKTTMLRLLATLVRPSSGKLLIEGMDVEQDAHLIRKCIGYMPQSFQAHPMITGREFLDYVAMAKGYSDQALRKRQVASKLEEVGLMERADNRIKTYSNGMKQRLGIAQAIIGDPSVLIIDEPTSGLDLDERVQFRTLLQRYGTKRTVVISTHIAADIESCCSRLAVLNNGRIRFHGGSSDLAAVAQGYVWDAMLSDEQFVQLRTERLVSAKKQEGGVLCRIIAEQAPVSGARLVEPTLEDGYLALIGGCKLE